MITAKLITLSLINPLIGTTLADTLENLRIYMEKMGKSLSTVHDDPSIGMFLGTCTAALFFEEQRLQKKAPEPVAPTDTPDPEKLAA